MLLVFLGFRIKRLENRLRKVPLWCLVFSLSSGEWKGAESLHSAEDRPQTVPQWVTESFHGQIIYCKSCVSEPWSSWNCLSFNSYLTEPTCSSRTSPALTGPEPEGKNWVRSQQSPVGPTVWFPQSSWWHWLDWFHYETLQPENTNEANMSLLSGSQFMYSIISVT